MKTVVCAGKENRVGGGKRRVSVAVNVTTENEDEKEKENEQGGYEDGKGEKEGRRSGCGGQPGHDLGRGTRAAKFEKKLGL